MKTHKNTWLNLLRKYGIMSLQNERQYKNEGNNPLKGDQHTISTTKQNDSVALYDWETSKIMCKAAEVGKIVVNKCLDRGLSINTQKLQKLLVLMQIDCIRRSGKPLFKEDIRIWNCGVAIKEVDDEFTLYAEKFTEHMCEFILLLTAEEKAVDSVISEYGDLDAYDLNKLADVQKVISLGVPSINTGVPHVTYQMLLGEYFK